MNHYLYALKFQTPVHFGNVALGGNLGNVKVTIGSNTLFAALCNEAAQISSKCVDTFTKDIQERKIQLSSLFPYLFLENEHFLFLPKPIQNRNVQGKTESFEKTKLEATKRKKVKNIAFIRTSDLLKNPEKWELEEHKFGAFSISEKVNCRGEESLPYFVGSYSFARNAGLYFVVSFQNLEQKQNFDKLLKLLGYTGIGGKRSSGYGKFVISEESKELSSVMSYKDEIALNALLDSTGKDNIMFMSISTCVPREEEITIVKSGTYKLLKHSGFISSPDNVDIRKKNSIYTLAEGSCFSQPLRGMFLTQRYDGFTHNIYINGYGMFVGVPNGEN